MQRKIIDVEHDSKEKSTLDRTTSPVLDGRLLSSIGLSPQDDLMKDHFASSDGQRFAGHHYLVDVWGEGTYLKSQAEIETILRDAAQAARATILHIHTHQFGDGEGISGIAILAESHISAHTWPERRLAAFDMFLCGDTDPEAGLKQIQDHTGSTRVIVSRMKRGLLDEVPART